MPLPSVRLESRCCRINSADRHGFHTLVIATVQALLHCAKNSMNMLKNRIQSRTGGTGAFLFVQKPFFEVGGLRFGRLKCTPLVKIN